MEITPPPVRAFVDMADGSDSAGHVHADCIKWSQRADVVLDCPR